MRGTSQAVPASQPLRNQTGPDALASYPSLHTRHKHPPPPTWGAAQPSGVPFPHPLPVFPICEGGVAVVPMLGDVMRAKPGLEVKRLKQYQHVSIPETWAVVTAVTNATHESDDCPNSPVPTTRKTALHKHFLALFLRTPNLTLEMEGKRSPFPPCPERLVCSARHRWPLPGLGSGQRGRGRHRRYCWLSIAAC